MIRSVIFAMGLAALPLVAQAQGLDVSNMTDAERDSFRAEVRAYLMDNPEVLMEAIAVLENRRAEEAAQAEVQILEENREAIFDDPDSWVGGNPDGDVTIVEFLDYQCGYCKRAFPAMEELIAGDGNIRFIVKEYPILGPASVLGSQYALATRMVEGDEAYKTVHDAMMLLRGALTEDTLARISEDAGLDHDAITDAMSDPEIGRIITENRALAQELFIQGTPSFVVGDQFVRGFLEGPEMMRVVEEVRASRG